MQALKIAAAVFAVQFAGGCAVMIAGSLPVERPPDGLRVGAPRWWVDRNYGYPVAAGSGEGGAMGEQVQFVDGVSRGWKATRIVVHSVLDYATYCIWEAAGTPLELASKAFGYPSYTYYLVYGGDGNVSRVVAADTEEGVRYSEMPWSAPRDAGLPFNRCPQVRNWVTEVLSGNADIRPAR